jgi:hypothetical protein
MNLLQEINKARSGDVITIPFEHNKLSRYIFMGKGLYHLIGGAGGSGKSAWIDLNYAIGPTKWYFDHGKEQGVKLQIILRSLERNKERRKAKWVCMYLYRTYGILIDTSSLIGWGPKKSRITDELYELIMEAYDWATSLEEVVEIVDGIENPTGIYKHFKKRMLEQGTLYYYKKLRKQEGEDEYIFVKETSKGEVKAHESECPSATHYQPVYVPDDPDKIVIGIVDHLQAMKNEQNFSDKKNLDKMSEYTRILRDLFGMSEVIVSQMNRNIADTFRRVKTDLLPEDKDFSGSSNMYNDCDMAGILFNPYKYKVSDVVGFKPEKCLSEHNINRFRSFHLLKNSYGPDNQIFGYQFIGENGLFKELPSPKDMNDAIYASLRDPKREQLIVNYTADNGTT